VRAGRPAPRSSSSTGQTSAKLFGIALRIVRQEDLAEDVLQDATSGSGTAAGDYREGLAAPMTWMASIVRNRSLDWVRRPKPEVDRHRRRDHRGRAKRWARDRSPRSSSLGTAPRLRAAWAELEAMQRQAILLAFHEVCRTSELARAFATAARHRKDVGAPRASAKLEDLPGRNVAMDLRRNAELQQRLARNSRSARCAARAPGGLRRWMRREAGARGSGADWELRLAPLALEGVAIQPPARVWRAIEDRLGGRARAGRGHLGESRVLAQPGPRRERSRRGTHRCDRRCTARRRQPAPQPVVVRVPLEGDGASYVAVLADPKTQKPMLIVSAGRSSNELWVKTIDPVDPRRGPQPRAVGAAAGAAAESRSA
jgi:DNA-directed RNA polymerase specialized sigma24 family protein